MNIVIFAAVDFPVGPATTSRVKLIAKALTLAGHYVTVASLQANTKIPYPGNTAISGEFENIHFTYLNGSTVRPAALVPALLDTLKGSLGAASYLWRMKREKKLDLVLFYTPDFFVILPSLLVAKLHGMTTVLELCEIFSVGYTATWKQRVKVQIAHLTETILPRVCSGVVVISTTIRERLLGNGVEEKKIFHLPILVDSREFMESSDEAIPALQGKKYFLNSGALGQKDGVDQLVAALALVNRQCDDVCLVLTGDPDDSSKQRILALARELGIAGRVAFTGFLSKRQLIWAYQNSVALLCCRKSDPFANYGSPTKLSEYLSTGKPVITNEMGDNKVYLRKNENAFVARIDDSGSIAEEMLRILAVPDLAARVGQEGQRTAQAFFHYENYALPLDAFLRSLHRRALRGVPGDIR